MVCGTQESAHCNQFFGLAQSTDCEHFYYYDHSNDTTKCPQEITQSMQRSQFVWNLKLQTYQQCHVQNSALETHLNLKTSITKYHSRWLQLPPPCQRIRHIQIKHHPERLSLSACSSAFPHLQSLISSATWSLCGSLNTIEGHCWIGIGILIWWIM